MRGKVERYLEGACNRCGEASQVRECRPREATGRVTYVLVKKNGSDYFVIARGV